jgi:hypothetical protein
MSEVLVGGWDLNFWFNEKAGEWNVSAYPYDQDGNVLGGRKWWLSLEISASEVAELKLGDSVNEHISDELDFWTDARWFIAEYPHLSASFMPKVISLPVQVENVENKLMKVEE